jgi:hypothetical protein
MGAALVIPGFGAEVELKLSRAFDLAIRAESAASLDDALGVATGFGLDVTSDC